MIGTGELIVIFTLILILFGGKKLPEFARSMGKGIREFKKACNEVETEVTEVREVQSAPEKATPQVAEKAAQSSEEKPKATAIK